MPTSAAATGCGRRNAIGTVLNSAIATPAAARRDRVDQHLRERDGGQQPPPRTASVRRGEAATDRRSEARSGTPGS